MDLASVVALAEILGTIAVVVSLVYVAIQIRQSTRATKLATGQNLSQDYREAIAPLHGDSELARIYLHAMQDVESLTGEDRFRAYVFTQCLLRTIENAYYQYRNGAVDEYVWEAFVSNLKFLKDTSISRAFWQDRQHIFSEEFREFYNEVRGADPRVTFAPYANDET